MKYELLKYSYNTSADKPAKVGKGRGGISEEDRVWPITCDLSK